MGAIILESSSCSSSQGSLLFCIKPRQAFFSEEVEAWTTDMEGFVQVQDRGETTQNTLVHASVFVGCAVSSLKNREITWTWDEVERLNLPL